MPQPVFRFAPTPNGRLHLGHALSAILNAEAASAAGGRFLVRIEDIDATRCRPEFEHAILEDLAWLGLHWETPVRRQSEHLAEHGEALDRLRARGLVYPSFLTRAALKARVVAAAAAGQRWPHDPDGAPLAPPEEREIAPADAERRIAAGEPYAWRLHIDWALAHAGADLGWTEIGPDGSTRDVTAVLPVWGDVVLARKDVPSSYHLSVVVDDAAQGVTHVVRGADLFPSTSVHRLLQTLLGLPAPVYRHHRLILGADGRKLSKSSGSTSLADLRKGGATPADIRRLVGLS